MIAATMTARSERFRRGLSLVEMIVVLAIITVLAGIVLVSSKVLSGSRRQAIAKQQLALLSTAIDRYASFWPAWKVGNVVVAEKGWPDFNPERLFPTTAFSTVTDFNDGDFRFVTQPQFDALNMLNGNACLVFALQVPIGKGPYITHHADVNLRLASEIQRPLPQPQYPTLAGVTENKMRELIVDPWGTPIRYFWVYRDNESNASNRSYTGYLPVGYGAIFFGAGAGGIDNADFLQADGVTRQTAVGFVLESAGPDKLFGHVWKVNPTQQEIDQASDNLMIKP